MAFPGTAMPKAKCRHFVEIKSPPPLPCRLPPLAAAAAAAANDNPTGVARPVGRQVRPLSERPLTDNVSI